MVCSSLAFLLRTRWASASRHGSTYTLIVSPQTVVTRCLNVISADANEQVVPKPPCKQPREAATPLP